MINYEIKLPLTKETILSFITEYDIFKYYIPSMKDINVSFKSELREDNHPSCRVFYTNNNKLKYKDFGIEGTLNCFQYVMIKYNISYKEALKKIIQDFNLDLIDSDIAYFTLQLSKKPVKVNWKTNKELTKILVKKVKFRKKDIEYWNQYNITQDWLEKAHISPITAFYIKTKTSERYIGSSYLSYCYDFGKIDNTKIRKIYQPFNNKVKFIGNVTKDIIQGYHLLPRNGNLLIITSSLKDVGTLFCNTNTFAIAPNSEVSFIQPLELYKLKDRFRNIVIWYDNDKCGILNAKKFSDIYKLDYIYIPEKFKDKDPSDFVLKYGIKELNLLLNYLLETKNIKHD